MTKNVEIYIEAVILYVVLFLAGSIHIMINMPAEAAEYSNTAELIRILLYNIPSIALIWYLIQKRKPHLQESLNIIPGKDDLISFFIALPCLIITGIFISILSSMTGTYNQFMMGSPSSAAGWVILCFSCISASYLEESFFRFYLLSKKDELNLNKVQIIAVSTALFSVCHLYWGFWGFLNAAISGTFLCLIFLRYKSIHGIAIAHALYNITAYALNALSG